MRSLAVGTGTEVGNFSTRWTNKQPCMSSFGILLTVKTWCNAQHTLSLQCILSTIWMKLQNLWYHMKDKRKQSFVLVRTREKGRSMRATRASKSSIMRCWKIKWSSAVNRWRSYNVYWTERSTQDEIIRLGRSSLTISMVILMLRYSEMLQDDTNIGKLQVSCRCKCHWCHRCHCCHLCLTLTLANTIYAVAPSLVQCMLGGGGSSRHGYLCHKRPTMTMMNDHHGASSQQGQ